MPGNAELLERVTARPDVFGGKPIVRDMRLSVEFILSLLSQGATQDEVLGDYPELESEDIRACIAYADTVIAGDTLAPEGHRSPQPRSRPLGDVPARAVPVHVEDSSVIPAKAGIQGARATQAMWAVRGRRHTPLTLLYNSCQAR